MNGALKGIKVLDLTQFLAGPYCTMLLADMGAEVVKIERPVHGEDNRKMGEVFLNGMSALFIGINRNKKSLSIDLKAQRGKALFRSLVREADVLVENFRPGTMEGLGLGYDDLKALNPRLIYAKISGFGTTGPYAEKGGFDLIMQAEAGLISITGDKDSRPASIPLHLVDTGTGVYTALGIVSALYARHQSGEGQWLETALFNTALGWAIGHITTYFAAGILPERMGTADKLAAPQQVFKAADGWMVLAAPSQTMWERVCDALDAAHLLADGRFGSNPDRVRNRDVLVAEIETILVEQPRQVWIDRLEARGVPCAPINTLDEAFNHPQTIANGMIAEQVHPVAGPVKLPVTPIKMSKNPLAIYAHAPGVGEQSASILGDWLLLPEEEIRDLVSAGVVYETPPG